MPRTPVAALVVALVVATAACGGDGEGSSSTTTAAERTTTTVATTNPAESSTTDSSSTSLPAGAEEVVLRGDGLGVVALGATPDDAVAAMTAALGPPTVDTGWESSFSTYGTCPGEQIRGVEWDHLVLLFTDGRSAYANGRHLFAWRITGAPPALGTANGFGYQATAADAEALYPGAVERVPAEEPFPAFLVIDAEGGEITAYLDDHDAVTNLEAGAPCGE